MPNSGGPRNGISVTEHEGTLLGLVARIQPATRYELYKAFGQSPTTTYNVSKGSLYPLIGRMIDRGFLSVAPSDKRRGSEVVSLTDSGREALRNWILGTEPDHSFTNDPILLRVMALGDVTSEERIRWVSEARALLLAKRQQLLDSPEPSDTPYSDIVQGTAVAIIDAKLKWLDKLLVQIAKEKRAAGTA
jgi:DNA-binding PadR family transcriptional regulator